MSEIDEIKGVLLWARSHRFRVHEVQVGQSRLIVDDLGPETHAKATDMEVPPVKSAQAAFAAQFGIPFPDDAESGMEDEDEPDPVET